MSNSITLGEIETRARNYSGACDLLHDRLLQLEDECKAARRRAMPLITTALRAAKAAESELSAGIQQAPDLFKRPRSFVFHGVRVGFAKGPGQITVADSKRTLALAEKHLSEDQLGLVIKTTKKLVKKALSGLPADLLKKIGVAIGASGDQVVVRRVDSALEKMLEALMDADEEQVELQEAA
jgi:hypothetical protein